MLFLRHLQHWDPARGVPVLAFMWMSLPWELSRLARDWVTHRKTVRCRPDDEEEDGEYAAQLANDGSHPTPAVLDVRAAVAELPLAERQLIYLLYWRDLKREEAAVRMRWSLSSVDKHKRTAFQELRAVLADSA